MGPRQHETRNNPPVEGLTVCAAHEDSMNRVFDKIDESGRTMTAALNGKMSKSQVAWTIGVLMSVAAAFGLMVWQATGSANDKTAQNIVEMDRRVLTLEIQWKQVQGQLDRIEQGHKEARTETAQQLEAIRKLVQEKKAP
jgi:hypothetical protein